MVAGLVEASLLKGLLAGMLGLVVTVLGNDPMMGAPRLTLGISFLEGGFAFLPVLIGVFAFAQIMSDVEKMRRAQAAAQALADVTRARGVAAQGRCATSSGRPVLLLWAPSSACGSACCRRSAAARPT